MVEPKCSDCPLNGQKKVYGGWSDPSDTQPNGPVVEVGMAPAKEEGLQGKVFVGISGQILKAINQKLGYENPYLCNSLLCELPDEISDADRALAIECCKGRLLEEITIKSPKLIIALGAMPFEELCGNYAIMRSAGRVFPTEKTEYGIAPVLPVIHPAFVWRNPDVFYDFVEQMESGIRWLNGTYQSAVSPTVVIATRDNISEILDVVGKAEVGSLDLETTGGGFYPYGWNPDQIRCLVFAVDNKTSYIIPGYHCGKDNPYWDYWEDGEIEYENLLINPEVYPRLKEIIEKGKWRFHNGQFDCGFLYQIGIRPKIYFDSMLAHYTLDEREYAHSLKRLSHKYLGAPDWEDDIRDFLTKKADTYDKVPNSKLFWYGAHDGIYTNQISERLEEDTEETWFLHNILLPSANMFNELRHRGIRIDPRELMSLDDKLDLEVSKSEDELNELCGEPINPNSPQEVMELLYDKLRYPIHPRYGRTSNKKALANFLPDPIVEKVIECRHLSKLKNTYVESLAKFTDRDMRIHPFTWLIHAVTGRLATDDPSVMNIAKRGGIMRIYIPNEGHKFAAFDTKQMELRCGALEANDDHLKELLLSGRDPHREAAVQAYGEDLADKKRGPAKTVVFGRFYGRGVESVMYAERLSREEAENLVATVDSFYPNLHRYQERIRNLIHTKGYLVSRFGRYRRFGLITKENVKEYERQGYNFPIQSMASDINLLCMLYLYGMREELGATPLWPIHDSIMFDIEDEAVIPRIKKLIETHAEELVGGEMKFPVDVKVGDNWGDAIPWEEDRLT